MTLSDSNNYACKAGYSTSIDLATCLDDATSEFYVDICHYDYSFHADFMTNIRLDYGTEGLIDLCQKKCYVKDDTDAYMDPAWDLVSINEF